MLQDILLLPKSILEMTFLMELWDMYYENECGHERPPQIHQIPKPKKQKSSGLMLFTE